MSSWLVRVPDVRNYLRCKYVRSCLFWKVPTDPRVDVQRESVQRGKSCPCENKTGQRFCFGLAWPLNGSHPRRLPIYVNNIVGIVRLQVVCSLQDAGYFIDQLSLHIHNYFAGITPMIKEAAEPGCMSALRLAHRPILLASHS